MQNLAYTLNFKQDLNFIPNKKSYSIFLTKNFIMKKLFMLAFVATMSTAVFAQTTPTKQEERKDLRQDAKDLKKDKKQLRQDIKNGDKTDAKAVRQDMRADRK